MGIVLTFTKTDDASISEPVTLSEVKDYLQIAETSYYDTELSAMITAARQLIEERAGVSLITRTATAVIDGYGKPMLLPWKPVDAVATVEMWDGTTWGAVTYYEIPGDRRYVDVGTTKGRFKITYSLNADGNTVWPLAIKLHVAWWFNNRDSQDGNNLAPEAAAIIKAMMIIF